MATEFSRTLSMLRREQGLSQRKVAAELGISQALLSHYENGIREPGLQFVTKVCDYYHVSADYLLGRTLDREGTTIAAADLYDSSAEKGTALRGSIAAMLQKKLIVNTASMLFDLLGKVGDREAIQAAAAYLGSALFKLYRHLYRAGATRRSTCPWATAPSIPARWTPTCTWPKRASPPPWTRPAPPARPSPT